jgi:alpha-mannosidase
LAAGIAAAREIGLLEDSDAAPLQVARGAALVELAPFGTATVAIRPRASAAIATSPCLRPEPVQPMHARYWLHGKGPAPAGNVPVAVHLTPNRVTLRPTALEGFEPPAPGTGDAGVMRLTVACGPEPASGEVSLIVPDGLVVSAGDMPAPSGTRLPYRLQAGEYASWDLAVRALPEAADGRYVVAARLTDSLGQELEDTGLVTLGEPGEVERDLGPEEQFFRMQADVMSLAAEVDLDVLPPSLNLEPGTSGSLEVRVSNNLAAELRGEVQVLSPFGSWRAVPAWAMAVRADAGGAATLSVPVTIPPTAPSGWESWLVVKLMYFGRVRYSKAVRLTVG